MSATETKQKLLKHVNLSIPLRPTDLQIQRSGKKGRGGDKTNKQIVQGDRTGRIFNLPTKLSEYQMVQGQEAVLTFKKGENK